jgi:hypothetical protein
VKKTIIISLLLNNLKNLSFKNLLNLFGRCLLHPLFAILTFWATIKTYSIAEKLFPLTNSTNGEGNAFRHALWNCLILMYCCKISSPEKALQWTKEITDLYFEIKQKREKGDLDLTYLGARINKMECLNDEANSLNYIVEYHELIK